LKAVPAVHSDVGSSVSHLVVGAEVVMPPVHAKLVGEVSCLPIQGKEPGRFGRAIPLQVPDDEHAVAHDFERAATLKSRTTWRRVSIAMAARTPRSCSIRTTMRSAKSSKRLTRPLPRAHRGSARACVRGGRVLPRSYRIRSEVQTTLSDPDAIRTSNFELERNARGLHQYVGSTCGTIYIEVEASTSTLSHLQLQAVGLSSPYR
jgi:hypothetical protein